MMITEKELTLPKTIHSISASIENISKSYLIYVTKMLHRLGINAEALREQPFNISPLKISSLSYFKALIKHIKHDDVYLNLHMTFLLTKPNIKDYFRNILFFQSYFDYATGNSLIFEAFYEKFGSNQTILALQNYVNTEINKQKIEEDIAFIFKSDDFDNSNEDPISFDVMLNEIERINSFFKHFSKNYRQYAKNKVISGFFAFAFLLYPSTYTKKLIQCKDAVKTSCFSALYSINPYLSINILNQTFQRNYQCLGGSALYSNVYQPFENLSVHIKEKSINIYADLSSSSFAIKDSIADYISGEISKLRKNYGNFGSWRIKQSKILIIIKSQIANINKNWLHLFVNQLNDNFAYAKAKGIIDNLYVKWLQSNKIEGEKEELNNRSAVPNYISMMEMSENNKSIKWNIQRHSFNILSPRKLSSDTLVFDKERDDDDNEDDFGLKSIAQSEQVMIDNNNNKTENTDETNEGKGLEMMSVIKLSKDLTTKGNNRNTDFTIVDHVDDISTNSFNNSMQYNDSTINKDNETQSMSFSSIDFSTLSESKYQKNTSNPFSNAKKKKKGGKYLKVCLNEIH